ncbi:DNA alkylation repair protein [Elizabethkingia meningoseptica]|uniref:DNA alkylation repair protein n=1 Tax=Elizabethkingia meningoseptica TaxID=238 RepID=A0A1V3TYT9_ELIME|nr:MULTISPECIES: DNA alkylation repair protein [Elizabethkingia]AQX04237.1 DNA alkylation repair protein [Elizabethkingia meningoseptica]AQX11697.1 DNA alkylation repair protein [Elizabethkingia meningoseptica]AQX46279.1 DNA alkylation repair protein [Elizabethkingia meningoseptica]EOR30795.1 DNA alkylation repair enzyme [Elizabethkingia meningoseptica ATCC 13253 = NBRC 12535]KUY18795.1 DNA alkylation repair protein [Elizabethkingia meningoseptica]
MNMVIQIEEALQMLATPERAEHMPRYFKTGKGEYGEGDVFYGVSVPDQRSVAKEYYKEISLEDLSQVLKSEIHEMRLTAVLILVYKYEKSKNTAEKKELVDFYLQHLDYVNNWDIVDSSAYKILGAYIYHNGDEKILYELSSDENMWRKRVAVVGTYYFIKKKSFELTQQLVLKNIKHPHDLMHKANGWMLREIGKIDEDTLLTFLNQYYKEMPRTSLRYAIEKLDEGLRQDYLRGNI